MSKTKFYFCMSFSFCYVFLRFHIFLEYQGVSNTICQFDLNSNIIVINLINKFQILDGSHAKHGIQNDFFYGKCS